MSLFAEQNDLQFAVPGGLIGKKNKVFTLCCMIGATDDIAFLKKPKSKPLFEKHLQTKLLQFLMHEGVYVDVYNLADKLFLITS